MSSSLFIKNEQVFSGFDGWQEGYGIFTYSITEKDRLIEYVKNQEQHHRKKSFREEYIELLKEHEIDFKEEYLF